MANDTAGKGWIAAGITLGRDIFSLLRDAAVFVLALLLLLFPTRLNEVLTRAGFEEGSIVGFKWKSQLVEADEALKEAQATIGTLQRQLQEASAALAAAREAVGEGSALQQRIDGVERAGRALAQSTAAATQAVQSAISANAPLVERAQQSLPAPGGWAVVFGSDRSLAAAGDEIARARALGVQGTGIYRRNDWYASLAVVASHEEAAEYLQRVRTFRDDAYLTRFASWCRTPQPRDGHVDCGSTR